MTTIAQAIPDGLQRRVENRGTFGTALQFAEYAGDELPSDDAFISVRGKNLSQSGLAFITPRWISQRDIILKLRSKKHEEAIFVARIVRCERLAGDHDEYYIGCEFLGEWE